MHKTNKEYYLENRIRLLAFKKQKGDKRRQKINTNVLKVIYERIVEKPIDEEIIKIEPIYCIIFGCGKQLTLVEKLAGLKCLKCQTPIRTYEDY